MVADRSEQGAAAGTWTTQDAASGWQSGAAARGQSLGPATDLMLDLAGVGVGSRVLDVGTGSGDQALVAAQRVGPSGAVLATDPSASMVDLTAEAVRAAGFREVDVRRVQITWRFPSLEEALANTRDTQPPLARLLGMLSDADRAAAWTEIRQALQRFAGPDGFEAPGEALIASGTA
jgi:SAM-dependent methyltransferase